MLKGNSPVKQPKANYSAFLWTNRYRKAMLMLFSCIYSVFIWIRVCRLGNDEWDFFPISGSLKVFLKVLIGFAVSAQHLEDWREGPMRVSLPSTDFSYAYITFTCLLVCVLSSSAIVWQINRKQENRNKIE